MQITTRAYSGQDDFVHLGSFLAQCHRNIDHIHYLHVGDLTWQVFHMLADYQPSDILHLWEDEQKNLIGFVLVYPPFGMFDLQLLPTYSGTVLETEMLAWVNNYFKTRQSQATSSMYSLVHESDSHRIALLESQGFVRGGRWLYLQRSLTESFPKNTSLEGFTLREVASEVEAVERARVLGAAFGAPVYEERYRQFMCAPGYIPKLDIVAVSENGQFAAFAMCWVDTLTKVGQFEPVGTAPHYRQKGLGKAVLLEGLKRMSTLGAKRVIVIVEEVEEAAVQLYKSVGLKHCWNIHLYSKQE